VIPSCKVQQADKENEEMVKLTIGEDPARPVMIGLIRLMSKLIRQRKAVTVRRTRRHNNVCRDWGHSCTFMIGQVRG